MLMMMMMMSQTFRPPPRRCRPCSQLYFLPHDPPSDNTCKRLIIRCWRWWQWQPRRWQCWPHTMTDEGDDDDNEDGDNKGGWQQLRWQQWRWQWWQCWPHAMTNPLPSNSRLCCLDLRVHHLVMALVLLISITINEQYSNAFSMKTIAKNVGPLISFLTHSY